MRKRSSLRKLYILGCVKPTRLQRVGSSFRLAFRDLCDG